ncbi:MAG: type IV secretory system conjugative DNA transfer family protein [Rhodomicrobium sp.]
MQADEFEKRLRQDLPRGQLPQPKSGGRERGLFARWLTPDEMADEQWRHEGGLLLGKRVGRPVGWNDDRHVLTIAGSRAGKGVSLIIPNLLIYEGSALVIDPKGENARFTAGRRGKGTKAGGPGLGQDVYVIDPFAVSGHRSSSFNPLVELDPRSDYVAEDAAMFADALIMHPDRGERHWTESAQALLRALILVVLSEPRPARRNLVTVRRLLMLTDRRIRDVQYVAKTDHNVDLGAQEALMQILRAQRWKPYGHICVGVAEQLEAMGPQERGSVLSTAKTQTQWLDDRRMKRVLCRSDFDMADLKRKATTVYLCLPAMRMGTHARWLRLTILLALSVMERTRGKPPSPVLFVLDEFPVLGHIQAIETAAGLMAGFGVKLWTILQNVGQLRQHYDKAWQTFFANAGVVTAFGVADQESLKVVSDMLGRTRMAEQVSSGAVGSALLSGAPAFKDDHFEAPLLAEHELARLFSREQKRVLILGAGLPPGVAERFIYYDKEEPMFKGLYDEA